ncbi:hypothetical protein DPMN_188299 [Dreissena polymorpha]|uniref:Uncharacterized protein n=1 Tax=Dreissena polymorpha TaxID=45954 RepID=A0A9D4IB77_DREPO|nr:hypothetical protein DPMN_188299 [Dreissena polymorpha]
MYSRICCFLLMVSFGLVLSQLVTPFMICEWEQMKLRNVSHGVSFDNPVMVEIRDYCSHHAYQHIGNLGTLGK